MITMSHNRSPFIQTPPRIKRFSAQIYTHTHKTIYREDNNGLLFIFVYLHVSLSLFHAVFPFYRVHFFFLLVDVDLLEGLIRLIVQDDQVTVADIEAGQMLTRVLRVEDVFIDHECRSSCLGRVASAEMGRVCEDKREKRLIIMLVYLSDYYYHYYYFHLHANLPDTAVFAEDVVHLFRRDLIREVAHVQNAVHLGSEPGLWKVIRQSLIMYSA